MKEESSKELVYGDGVPEGIVMTTLDSTVN